MTAELLQMLREALHNVQKHASATRVAVSMEKTDRGLEISVDDNGHGFNFAGTYTLEEMEMLRLGPASLKRRRGVSERGPAIRIAPRPRGGLEVSDTAAMRQGPGPGARARAGARGQGRGQGSGILSAPRTSCLFGVRSLR